jgi:hypothetical protein
MRIGVSSSGRVFASLGCWGTLIVGIPYAAIITVIVVVQLLIALVLIIARGVQLGVEAIQRRHNRKV